MSSRLISRRRIRNFDVAVPTSRMSVSLCCTSGCVTTVTLAADIGVCSIFRGSAEADTRWFILLDKVLLRSHESD